MARLTYFPRWPRALAMLFALALVGPVAFGLASPQVSINAAQVAGPDDSARGPIGPDLQLYTRVVRDVRDRRGYYESAAAGMRANNFPLKPFATFRLPTLAYVLSVLGDAGRWLLGLLIAATLMLWYRRWRGERTGAAIAIPATLLAAVSMGPLLAGPAYYFHEVWAGVLIALSLSLVRRNTALAIAAGLAAAAIREMAAAYLFAMLVLALAEKRWRAAAGWAGALAAFAILLALHAEAVSSVVVPGDPVSQGWSGLGGYPALLSALRLVTPLAVLPYWVAALAIPLAFAGWAAWDSPYARAATLAFAGYGAMVMLFARPENFYWTALIAPLLLSGLAFVPRLAIELYATLTGARTLDSRAKARQ